MAEGDEDSQLMVGPLRPKDPCNGVKKLLAISSRGMEDTGSVVPSGNWGTWIVFSSLWFSELLCFL